MRLYWDSIAAISSIRWIFFRLSKATVTRGQFSAALNVQLNFDGDWSFVPSSAWTARRQGGTRSVADLQAIFGTNYPVTGFLSGDFRGEGTSAVPVLNGILSWMIWRPKAFISISSKGQLHLAHDEIDFAGRTPPRHRASGRNVLYRPAEQTMEFNLNGTGIPAGKIRRAAENLDAYCRRTWILICAATALFARLRARRNPAGGIKGRNRLTREIFARK